MKYTNDRTVIQTHTPQNYKILIKEISEQNIHFYTYTPKEDKTCICPERAGFGTRHNRNSRRRTNNSQNSNTKNLQDEY